MHKFLTVHSKDRLHEYALRAILFSYITFLVLVEMFVIMPELFSDNWSRYGSVFLLGAYFLLGFVSHAVRVVRNDPSICQLSLSNKISRNWTYCTFCQTARPPRAHHCRICDTCVLRRDHHCIFLAQCIGHANWRFFFGLLIFGICGSTLASLLNLFFIFTTNYLPANWHALFRSFCLVAPPGLLWIFGLITWTQTILFTMTTVCLIFAILLTGFVIYYMKLIRRNRTLCDDKAVVVSSEETGLVPTGMTVNVVCADIPLSLTPTDHVSVYDLADWRANVSQFLGPKWFSAILVPFYSSQPTVDGISFPLSDQLKYR